MLTNHLVLAGGGHTHALILLRWAMNPHLRPKGMITLVNRHSTNIYSSMFPGVVSGKYDFQDIGINLVQLSNSAGISFVKAEILGLNPSKKYLILDGRLSLGFTHLSLDIGSETFFDLETFQKYDKNLACFIRPFWKSFEWIQKFDNESKECIQQPITVIGSGLSAIEISLALRQRWPNRKLFLQAYEEKINHKLRNFLINSNIKLAPISERVLGPALICTGNQSPQWLKESGLVVSKTGRVLTSNTLQAINYPYIFAAGDCGVIQKLERPPGGVWAVRAAKPLAKNLERYLQGLKPLAWKPQKYSLQLIGNNFENRFSIAWASWRSIVIGPTSFLWNLKEIIDRKFMSKFNLTQGMSFHKRNKNNSCRGCGAKVGASTLRDALKESNFHELSKQPQDAVIIFSSLNNDTWVQSVDGFPALLSDPWLNARITTLHACSDIWAVGATVKSAQAVITIPEVSSNLQKELLRQCLGGIKSALHSQNASLIGGHTCESRSSLDVPITLGIQISLTVNGVFKKTENVHSKADLKPGDNLLLSRPLGSGVVFAASMHGAVHSNDLDEVLNQLTKSQHSILDFQYENVSSNQLLVNACTDITGFGLLGHLGEMISSSNLKRCSQGKSRLKVKLYGDSIPSFKVAKSLLSVGYRSTLAESNATAFSYLESNYGSEPLIRLCSKKRKLNHKEINLIKQLIIDPQTCGPLLISCDEFTADFLLKEGGWTQIGLVEEFIN